MSKNFLSNLADIALDNSAIVASVDIDNQTIADVLANDPGAMARFEAAYRAAMVSAGDTGSVFTTNAKQAVSKLSQRSPFKGSKKECDTKEEVERIISLIVDDFIAERKTSSVSIAEINRLPEQLRPQLTVDAASRDLGGPPAAFLALEGFRRALKTGEQVDYLRALQGLDVPDLDPVIYEILGRNTNSMGHWLPQLIEANAIEQGFMIPETKVVTVPLPILQMSRLEFSRLTPTTLAIIDRWAQAAFGLDTDPETTPGYFVKTGTFSSKFDFRNARVTGPNEVAEIGQYLTFIQHQANMMAMPGNTPVTPGVSTTNEWVVREWIEDNSGAPTIYHGMPLRTEFRVFIDPDADAGRGEVLGVANYWDPEVMLDRFENQADAQHPDMLHDAVIYRSQQETLVDRYANLKGTIVAKVEALLPHLDLRGQWSLDVMCNDTEGDQLYLIDMSLADNSAFNGLIDPAKRRHTAIGWVPELTD